ncbi:MAG: hypothetical protein JWR59_2410, partial [Brevundimonas sp.]|nr:hypothetical protein [Brevundimonas sp.]
MTTSNRRVVMTSMLMLAGAAGLPRGAKADELKVKISKIRIPVEPDVVQGCDAITKQADGSVKCNGAKGGSIGLGIGRDDTVWVCVYNAGYIA